MLALKIYCDPRWVTSLAAAPLQHRPTSQRQDHFAQKAAEPREGSVKQKEVFPPTSVNISTRVLATTLPQC